MADPVDADRLVDLGYEVSGVVHVGANRGQEVERYVEVGWPVLALEPHPEAFEELREAWIDASDVRCIWLALGRERGILTLHIPQDGDTEKSSKFLTIPTDGHAWTLIPNGATVEVPVMRGDEWFEETGLDPSPYSTLVIDVQGMELEVLEGMGDYLHGFDHLIVELSSVPVYAGEPPAEAVIAWLGDRGFVPISEMDADGVFHDDVLFVRSALLR